MNDVILSAASRRNIFELQRISTLIGASQNRLATGLRVGSPLDNPSSYFTASALRGRTGALERLVDDTGLKLQTLQAADAALGAVSSLVQNAQAVLNEAQASPEPQPAATGNIIVSSADNVTDLAGVADGDQFSVQVGAASAVTITIADSDTPTTLLNKLNAVDNVSAEYTDDGYLQITSANGEDLTLTDVTNTPLAGLGIEEGTFDYTSAPNDVRAGKAAEFDVIREQIDQLIGDATFNGVNLLAGDSLSFLFNETGSSGLTIDGVAYSSSGLGISQAGNDFQLDGDINAAKAEVSGALDTVRSYSARLATDLAVSQIRGDFNNTLANRLQGAAGDLTRADLNEEGARLLSLQTRRGLASTALSLLQQSESNVLRLFD